MDRWQFLPAADRSGRSLVGLCWIADCGSQKRPMSRLEPIYAVAWIGRQVSLFFLQIAWMLFGSCCVPLAFAPAQTIAIICVTGSMGSFASSLGNHDEIANCCRQLDSIVDHIRSVGEEIPDRERIVALRSN